MAKHLEKSPENSSEAETSFWWNSNLMCRWLGALECVYQIWGLYMIFNAINADKWLWPIYGCKVGQSVPIGMKLELDV